VPFNRSTPILYVNRRALDAARITPPSTWDELANAAVALTHRDAGTVRWGYETPISWWFWVALVGQAGGTVVAPDGTPTLGGEAGVRALEYWQRLVHRLHAMRPPPGRDYNAWEAANQDFLAERAAMVMTSSAFLRYLERNASFPVQALAVPRDVRASVPTGGTFWVMLRQAPREEREAGWRFLRWMCSPEQTAAWATGTGYLPVTEPAIARLESSGYYREHPNDRIALDQLRYAQPWPWSPNLFRVQRDAVEPRLEQAVLTQRNARAALDEARAAAREG
jgi:sn-glycerol 3-phosphate transport system substrate-binding protein